MTGGHHIEPDRLYIESDGSSSAVGGRHVYAIGADIITGGFDIVAGGFDIALLRFSIATD